MKRPEQSFDPSSVDNFLALKTRKSSRLLLVLFSSNKRTIEQLAEAQMKKESEQEDTYPEMKSDIERLKDVFGLQLSNIIYYYSMKRRKVLMMFPSLKKTFGRIDM